MKKATSRIQINLQVLGKGGHYPSFSVRSRNHLFVPNTDIVWCAVKHVPPKHTWHEVEIFTYFPEEIRLLGAISLAAGDPWDDGRFSVCPWLRSEPKVDSVPPFGSDEFIAYGTNLASQLSASSGVLDYCAFSSQTYSLGEQQQGSEKGVKRLIRSIDPSDHLLIGGLSRYLSAQRLALTYAHFEEASLLALLALDAALEYLRLALAERIEKSLKHADVYKYLADEFPQGEVFSKWLIELYDNRIMLVHPASRLGESWTAPMLKNELWDLIRWLVLIYRHILLGEIPKPSD
jgi:hypothetical protein